MLLYFCLARAERIVGPEDSRGYREIKIPLLVRDMCMKKLDEEHEDAQT